MATKSYRKRYFNYKSSISMQDLREITYFFADINKNKEFLSTNK